MFLGVVVFVGVCLFSVALLAFFPLLNAFRFRPVVFGWDTKSNGWPIASSPISLARMNNAVIDECLKRGFSRRELYTLLNGLKIVWVPHNPQLEGMAVFDPYQRKHPDGRPWEVAGWQKKEKLHVVYKKGVKLEDTAYLHELLHMLQGKKDLSHADPFYWGEQGLEKTIKARYHRTMPF